MTTKVYVNLHTFKKAFLLSFFPASVWSSVCVELWASSVLLVSGCLCCVRVNWTIGCDLWLWQVCSWLSWQVVVGKIIFIVVVFVVYWCYFGLCRLVVSSIKLIKCFMWNKVLGSWGGSGRLKCRCCSDSHSTNLNNSTSVPMTTNFNTTPHTTHLVTLHAPPRGRRKRKEQENRRHLRSVVVGRVGVCLIVSACRRAFRLWKH